MPLSAVDAIGPAFQHTKKQLIQPFRYGQWLRLAIVGVLAGELTSGGGGPNFNLGGFNFPQQPRNQLLGVALPPQLANNPALVATLILFLVIFGIVFFFGFMYVSSVMRFILFDSVIAKECHIRDGWMRRQSAGLRYFGWQLLVMAITLGTMVILIGIPAGFAFAVGWLKAPKEHMVPLILGGIVLFFAFVLFMILAALVHVMTKDFVVPQMALENIGAIEGWRRFWPRLTSEKGGFAGYIGMKIVMALGAGVVIGVAFGFILLILLIPVGGLGAVAIISGKMAGLTWNAYTITLIVIAACFAIVLFVFLLGCLSVPATVFFPAYSIYFFASRYPALANVLYPPAPVAYVPRPPEPPPVPPAPEPIG